MYLFFAFVRLDGPDHDFVGLAWNLKFDSHLITPSIWWPQGKKKKSSVQGNRPPSSRKNHCLPNSING